METPTRTYTDLLAIPTFEERFAYLRLKGSVGYPTFGSERYVNQKFYTSMEWRNLRHEIIVRDNGCDLGIPDREIPGRIIIHHMNPVKMADLVNDRELVLDPEFLISVAHNTHNAIHYGDENLLVLDFVERRPGDTQLWSRKDDW